jgi:hypothetical protein
MANVVIDIAAEFTGNKAFKQADTATQKLTSNVKKLAGAVGLAYGTSAIIAYGKVSVKAFAADEAAALRLSRAVTNLGIGFANPAIADYIGKLEKSAAIADDILRPAFQSLLTTTGSLTKSQELLNNAITISRGSGIDLATVTDDLAKGYVGITKGLTKYNTGLTKAELTSKSFSEILAVMLTKSAGAAEDYLGSTSYTIDVLSIATQNASEIIGGGLVDAFARVAGGTEASDAATAIEGVAKAIAFVERAIGTTIGAIPSLIKNLKNLPSQIFSGFAGKAAGVTIPVQSKKAEIKLTLSQIQQQELLKRLEDAAAKRAKELLALKNKQAQADKLKLAIAKANALLGKGNDVFNLDAIQVQAALINQAEQLGKATTSSQILQIANDTARLNLKKDILDLEKAIADGDTKAIEAATLKLNKDLEIFNTLSKQNIKLADIKSILDTLTPKDLVNQKNLDDALAKIKEMLALLGQIKMPNVPTFPAPSPSNPFVQTPNGISPTTPANTIDVVNKAVEDLGGVVSVIGDNGKEFIKLVEGAAPIFQQLEDSMAKNLFIAQGILTQPFNAGTFRAAEGGSIFSSGAVGSRDININVTTGVGDPNAIAEAVNQVIQDAVDRGTLRGGSY